MDLDEYKDMFLSETTDHLQSLTDNLLILEKDPSDQEALKVIFRSTHTIKGMAATMGYENITKVSHELESALNPFRKDKLPITEQMVQMTFEGIDLLKKLKEEVNEGKAGSVPINDFLGKIAKLQKKGTKLVDKAPVTELAKTKKKTDYPVEVLEDKPIPTETLEYLDMFMSEAQELLQSLNENMLKLEKAPDDAESLASVFRSSHTIKGMSATMGFTNMSKLTHELETALDFYRKTKQPLDERMINVTFECLDKLEKLNEEINDGKVGGVGIRDQMIKLMETIEDNSSTKKAGKGKGVKTSVKVKRSTAIGKPSVKEKPPVREDPKTVSTAPAKPMRAAEKAKKEMLKASAEEKALKGTATIRISIQNLESLMNLVGELVINKSRLMQIGQTYELNELNEALGRIDRLTTDLQDEVLTMRMVPTRYIFNRFPRMVRDLARAEGKDVDFIVIGWDIELDRTVLDEISEPLVHLLRNSIDHGLEKPTDREKNGKSKKGTIKLVAVREKNHVKITVEDDGKGIDPKIIKKKAIEKGLVDEVKAAELTKQECINLLFLPGFSTAQKVSSVSGRGVGMDVVKTKIESLGGMTEMFSEPGEGTKTILTLPLTMAIIRALLVRVGLETYALPISMVLETGRFKDSQTKTLHGRKVIVLRDEVIPLINLHDVFQVDGYSAKENLIIVFVEHGNRKLGLLVDHLIGQQEIVIKPLGKIFQNIRGIAGATILGDGRVALILDVATLI